MHGALIERIKTFITEHEFNEQSFGRATLKDENLMRRLHDGFRMRENEIETITEFMRLYPPKRLFRH